MVAITQGDTDSGRTGNSILLRNIYIRGQMTINSSVTSNTRISLVLVKDAQQAIDTVPNMSDIFTNYNDPDTLLNLNQSGRFKIVWRRTFTLTPVGGGRSTFDINKYWKCYDHVRYNGATSTDISRNGYYFIILTSENTNYPTVAFNSRIGYRDN